MVHLGSRGFGVCAWNAPELLAQGCAMCKTVAAAQSKDATASLNWGILLLLVPPVTIMSSLLLFAFRCRMLPSPLKRQTHPVELKVSLPRLPEPARSSSPSWCEYKTRHRNCRPRPVLWGCTGVKEGGVFSFGWRDFRPAGSQWKWQDFSVSSADNPVVADSGISHGLW